MGAVLVVGLVERVGANRDSREYKVFGRDSFNVCDHIEVGVVLHFQAYVSQAGTYRGQKYQDPEELDYPVLVAGKSGQAVYTQGRDKFLAGLSQLGDTYFLGFIRFLKLNQFSLFGCHSLKS